jgi:dolichol-phosphate mannosyltransferase
METEKIVLSIVSPVYRAEETIDLLYSRIKSAAEKITSHYQVILVDDRSPDNSWIKLKRLALSDNRVKAIRLSRNFGQHPAITAGLKECTGEWVVVMDCDLQDQPEEIEKLLNKARQGYDIVLAQRIERKDSFFKKLFSKLFYRSLSYLTDTKQDPTIANFGIYKNKVIEAVLSMNDSLRYFPTMARWVGFSVATVNVDHAPRSAGKTTYNFKKLLQLALDIIVSFSEKPLRIAMKFGIFISLVSFLIALITIALYLQDKIMITGWASLMVSLWFLAGMIIFIIGVAGIYIGKTFQQVKSRPIFIVDEKIENGK